MALAAEQAPDGPAVVAVVCDGVSSSARPDEASQVAAQAALPVLVAAVQAGGDLGQASRDAVAAARRAIADLQGPGGDTSATTFVSAVASGYEVTLCWLGDSRAYWLGQPAEESRLLTHDDSVAGGMIAAGLVDEAAAMASPHAHVLTRWLGGEAADLADDPERAPHVERFTPPGAGSLLICSDGLWNYLAEGRRLGQARAAQGADRPARCRRRHGEVRARRRRRRQHHRGPDPLPRPRDPLTRPHKPPILSAGGGRLGFSRPPSVLGPTNSSSRATAARRATDMTSGRETA